MLRKKLKDYNIILASKSPRRHAFFKDLDIDFSIQIKEIKEIYPLNLRREEITDYLSELKASVFTDLSEKDILVTSDTIVWYNENPLGKPKSKEESFSMLRNMSGNKHTVYTSICLKSKKFTKVFNDKTDVWFSNLSDDEINYYIDNYKPFDKAGSYGIQDWIGLIGIERIEGSYFNVMGLPVQKLYKELMSLPH